MTFALPSRRQRAESTGIDMDWATHIDTQHANKNGQSEVAIRIRRVDICFVVISVIV